MAAALVCERLTAGRLLAVDRSSVAIERTAERNAEHLASGRLDLLQSPLDALTVAPSSIDTAFAINVNLFWVASPRRELAVLRQALRPGGTLHVLYGAAGPADADRVTGTVSAALRAHGFTHVAITDADARFGVLARAPAPSTDVAPPRRGGDLPRRRA